MLPELARRAISAYSDPGDLILDPLCGIGTTLVEAAHLGRRAIGVEREARWATLAEQNVELAAQQGASGQARVLCADARDFIRRLASGARALLDPERPAGSNLRQLPYGRVDLVLTSPPYGCDVGRPQWQTRDGRLCPKHERNYSRDRANLGHARGSTHRNAMADVYRLCAAVLKPGGFLVVVTRDTRRGGRLHDLAGETIGLCEQVGLAYWQHIIALQAAIRDGALTPGPCFWQRVHIARERKHHETRMHMILHEDVLVFRRPDRPAGQTPARKVA